MSRRIRISFLIDRLTRAGTETQLLALIRSLDRARFEPSLVLLDGDDSLSRTLAPGDCDVLSLGVKSLHSPRAVAAATTLARRWRRERIDVVQSYFLDSTYFGVPLARVAGVPRIVRVRNNLGHWLTPRHRSFGRVISRLVDATLTNCEPARTALLSAEGGDARKVVVLENGVDLDRFMSILPPRDRPTRVGVVANLRPVKGVDVLIRAAARLAARHPNLTFHVAGDGEQRVELEQLVVELGLTGRVHFHGSTSDVPAFLADLDVVVLPSRAEGMSNALLEAMAAGRPIVATDVGANRHLLGGGELGILVPPDEPDLLARGIGEVIDDIVVAGRRAAAARRHVSDCYSREAMRVRFEQFYERLCA